MTKDRCEFLQEVNDELLALAKDMDKSNKRLISIAQDLRDRVELREMQLRSARHCIVFLVVLQVTLALWPEAS